MNNNKKHTKLVLDKDEYIDPIDLVKTRSTDARLWSKSFMDKIKQGYFSHEDIDKALMASWLASAIGTTEDKIGGNK